MKTPAAVFSTEDQSERVPCDMRHRRWRALVLVLFGTAYAAVFAEVFLHLFAPVPILPRYVQATAFGIRGNSPNKIYWQRTPETTVQVRTNSKGIRADGEMPYEKPPGSKRIVVLGDSYGMGYEVDLKDSFLSQMETRLREAGVATEVVNLSVSGHGNAEELLMLRHEGLRYSPDIVILQWHRSDLEENVRSDLFTLKNDRVVRKADSYLPAMGTRQFLSDFWLYRYLDENSHLYTFIRQQVALLTKLILLETRETPQEELRRASALASVGHQESSYAERLSSALIHQIAIESAQVGAKLLILDVPTWYQGPHPVSSLPRDLGDLDVVSPLPELDKFRRQDIYWQRGNNHFTPLGCRIVGQALSDHILKNDLVAH